MGTLEQSSKNYMDFDIFGQTDMSGQIIVYTGIQAIMNGIRAWLASAQWSLIRRPTYGGKILPYLMKPITADNAANMQSSIKRELENEFTPQVKVTSCAVIPNYEEDMYEVHLEIYVPAIRDSGSADVSLRRLNT